ncbi:MAG: BCCT family transporter, partial [Pseudomonadota bacterium]
AGGKLFSGKGAAVIDSLALFALTAGVAASLGAGMMTLADGAARGLNLDDGPLLRLIVATVIVAVFTVSSVSGLQRGIKILSDLNIRIFFILAIFIFVAGPTLEIVKSASAGLVEYGATFLSRSVVHPLTADNQWQRDWTMFYYANWAAWAPITALFLGRISLGYTVREAILFNIVAPALFGILWMSIFGGAALELDVQSSQSLTQTLADRGPEAIVFSLLGLLPLASLMAPLFLFAMFISFVTAMDSNTHSIASVCLRANRQSDEVKGAGLWIKVFWGVAIGAVSWIMTSTNGIDGVKMLSNLGGAPGLVILLGCIVAIVRLILLGPKQLEQVKTAS